MAWAWVRPADPSLLDGRPLLDLGTGDGQTVSALASEGVRFGLDSSFSVLRVAARALPVACGEAAFLPFGSASVGTVLAADLFHHLDERSLAAVFLEVGRVLRPGGSVVAWWYSALGRAAPDSPRFPRTFESVAALSFAPCRQLDLDAVASGPPSVGLHCVKS